MKKGMRWCLLVSLIVVGIMIAGCSKGGSTASSPTASPPATTQSQPSVSHSIADLFNMAKQVQSMSLDYTVTSPNGTTGSGMMWVQTGKMMKTESTINGVQFVSIINLIDNTVTSYQPASNQGTKIKLGAMSQSQTKQPGDYLNGVDPSKVQDLGTAVLNSENCRVIQYTSTDGQTTTKMWLSEDLGFPVQLTNTTAAGQTTKIEFTNIKVGTLPSGTFSVPAGVKITDMTNMNYPQNIPPQQ